MRLLPLIRKNGHENWHDSWRICLFISFIGLKLPNTVPNKQKLRR